jgi:L-threonate 2-dehydrogenase
MRVAVIGLGKMGLPIARNLLERGFEVTGYRRSPGSELAAAGGAVAASAAEAAAQADVILSILPDTSAVEEIVSGPSGTLGTLRPGTVHIEMSTIPVRGKQRVRDAVRDAGGDLLDCPISGSPAMVAPRLATTFVSGARASADAVRPVLDAISGPWVYTGEFGTGASMKYVANMLLATHMAAAAEAILLARHLGLDLELVQQTLDDSIASSAIWRQRGPVMHARQWTPAPGPIGTLQPILEQIDGAAGRAGFDPPVFGAAKALFDKALADGWGELDIAAVHDLIAGTELAGAEPAGTELADTEQRREQAE